MLQTNQQQEVQPMTTLFLSDATAHLLITSRSIFWSVVSLAPEEVQPWNNAMTVWCYSALAYNHDRFSCFCCCCTCVYFLPILFGMLLLWLLVFFVPSLCICVSSSPCGFWPCSFIHISHKYSRCHSLFSPSYNLDTGCVSIVLFVEWSCGF